MNRSLTSSLYLSSSSGLSSVNFSSLAINDSCSTLASASTSSSSSSAAPSPTPLSQSTRWGSSESRQAYGDLSSLAKVPVAQKASAMASSMMQQHDEHGAEDEWGFFVDEL
ncbi:hypothetical protein MPSEU_000014200 [Mayamaea pseudoterrestris]|nr:hypothetical protein MPSEU_000014200 [Mayamaea pseudoterrestris]